MFALFDFFFTAKTEVFLEKPNFLLKQAVEAFKLILTPGTSRVIENFAGCINVCVNKIEVHIDIVNY